MRCYSVRLESLDVNYLTDRRFGFHGDDLFSSREALLADIPDYIRLEQVIGVPVMALADWRRPENRGYDHRVLEYWRVLVDGETREFMAVCVQ
jgi:hypothetical protein